MSNIIKFFQENPISSFFAIFIIIMVVIGSLDLIPNTTSSPSDHKKVLKNSAILEKAVIEESKKLPIDLGNNIIYKSIYHVFDTLIYVFEVSPTNVDNIKENGNKYEADLIQSVCSNEGMLPLLNAEINLEYEYREVNGNIIRKIKINKNTCM